MKTNAVYAICIVAVAVLMPVVCSATTPMRTKEPSITLAKLAVVSPKASSVIPKPSELDATPDMLYATGEGAMPSEKEQPNRAKAYLQAKAYAKMDAIAALAQAIKGVLISYTSTGENYIAETKIKEEIKGVLNCVQIVSVKKRAEGKDAIVEVTVRAPNPLKQRSLKQSKIETSQKSKTTAVAASKPVIPSWVAGTDRTASGYSSVIIDAKGYHIARSMSPRIIRSDGSEVWGTVKADPDFVCEHGIVAYVRSRPEAFSNRRAGDNPLIIRAIGRGPARSGSDIVVSDADAAKLLSEDRRTGFLGEYRVIIVVD